MLGFGVVWWLSDVMNVGCMVIVLGVMYVGKIMMFGVLFVLCV